MVGKYAWVPFIFGDIGYLFGGWLSGRLMHAGWTLQRARKFVMLAGACAMPAAVFAPLVPEVWMAIAATCFMTFGHSLFATNLQTLPPDLFRGREVGTATGFSGMGGAIGGILANMGTGMGRTEFLLYADIHDCGVHAPAVRLSGLQAAAEPLFRPGSSDIVRNMMSRRTVLLSSAAAAAAHRPGAMSLCIHQTTSAAAGYRASLEGYAKAGIKYVEVIPAHIREFVAKEGMPAAKRLLSDLGLKAVSCGGVTGLAEPSPRRAAAIEQLKSTVEMVAALGVDRMVCPCNASEKFVLDDYKRAQDNLREAGEIVKPHGVTAMLEFMRGSTFVGSLPTSLNLTRDTAHPNVRSMFDCYHFWAGLSKLEDLEMIHPGEIPHVHFQDVPKLPRELLDASTRDIPGDGVSPLKHILQSSQEKGIFRSDFGRIVLPKAAEGRSLRGSDGDPPQGRAGHAAGWSLVSEVVIRASKLTKKYRSGASELVVFSDMDLEVTRGERLALIGESGVGKSTLLYLLSGLDSPYAVVRYPTILEHSQVSRIPS